MPGAGTDPIRKNSIHRALVARLLLASIFISVFLVALILAVQFKNIETKTVEQALIQSERFRFAIIDDLDAPGLGNHARIQRIIDKMAMSKVRPTDVKFVFVRIVDLGFHEVAGLSDPAYDHIEEVNDYILKHRDLAGLRTQGTWNKMLRLGKAVIIDIGHTLRNSADVPVGYIEGLYVISPAFFSRARKSAIFTALMVAGIVLLTTIILYPSINTLLRRVSGLSANLLHANMEILSVLGSAVAKRDNDTDIHSYRVTIYAVRLAEELGLPENEIRALIKGAFLHDVGKIGIRDSILLKPSRLTSEEFKEMNEHIRHGMDIVSGSVWLHDAALVVGNHHEKYDGTGYLEKRANGDIPRVARIFAIADVFDALSSKRPYKDAMGYEETMNNLIGGKGSYFDPEILDVFIKIAPILYETYANRDDNKPRDDLKQINARYFGPDVIGDVSLISKG
jgi:HD-GYP domain-containing protein (c-di-GMP phosphodiesterase class II)